MNQDNQFSSMTSPGLQTRGQKRLRNSDSHVPCANKCEHAFVTLIRATDVACGLRRLPAGFHVSVEIDKRTIHTSNKPVSTEKDAVEWDVEIPLPSTPSSSILFSVYASFELGSRLGNGELLGQFKITVGEVFRHRNEQIQLIDSTAENSDVLPSCSSIRIIMEQRVCGVNESCPQLPESYETDALDQLTDQGHRALLGYRQRQDQMDLDVAVQTFQRVQDICPIDHPNRSAVLFNLANARFIDSQTSNRYLDLDVPIGLYRDALRLRSKNHPDHCTTVLGLGFVLLARFQRQGFEFDREEARDLLAGVMEIPGAESYAYRAVLFGLQMASLSVEGGDPGSSPAERASDDDVIQEARNMLRDLPYSNPRRSALLIRLGMLLSDRLERNGKLADIQEAISMFEHAADLLPHGHPDMLPLLSSLGEALLHRFNHLGDISDLNRSISMKEEVVCSTPDGHPNKPSRLNNLGISLHRRFGHLGNLADLNRSISMEEEAVCGTPDGHSNKADRLNNLGNSLQSRFERHGDLEDLNRSISIKEEAVCLTPDGHPHKPGLLNNLASSLNCRFTYHGDLADLNRSISMKEEAVYLTPEGHPEKPSLLHNLGISLNNRFKRHGDIADLTRSISMSEEAVCLTPDDHPHKPNYLTALGSSLYCCFERYGNLADLNRSILMFEQAICLSPDGHPGQSSRLNGLGGLLSCRFERLDDLTDLNRSILLQEQAVCLTPDDHPDKPGRLSSLANSLQSCFECHRDPTDLNRAISMKEEAVYLTPDGHPDKPGRLNNLGISLHSRFEHHRDLTDLNRSISMFEEAVRLSPDGHLEKLDLLNNLGGSLQSRFELLGDRADAVRSISLTQEAIGFTPDDHPIKSILSINLGRAFKVYFEHSHDSSDLSAAALNFSIASRASIGQTVNRFNAARAWIFCAQLQGNTTALLDACASALNILPQLAWLGLPVTERHRLLVEAADVTRDSVAAALEAGHPELAVEWLEQGRSIVWTQFLQLRTPADDLSREHPALASQIREISHELERASSARDNTTFSQPANFTFTSTRLLEKDIQRHHDLALRREELLLQIRSLPGFDRFLLSKTIKQLGALASAGPVIYLTANKERCDALIVMPELDNVIHVPLPQIRYENTEVLRRMLRALLERHSLVFSRDALYELIPSENIDFSKQFLDLLLDGDDNDSNERGAKLSKSQSFEQYTPNELYQRVLKFLWNEVVNPVLQALGFSSPPSGTDKMTRVFWCPTGPFSFLPIHAAGLYDTAETGTKLSDFVMSSYLPTLSSLASSPQNSLDTHFSQIRLLAVPQPSTDGLGSTLFSVKDEISSIRELSDRSPFVALLDSDGTVEDVIEKLKNTDWVHFACHGIQDPGTPLDSGLGLANNRRLKLSDIMQLSRPQGGLAFLSACQTAQGDETLSDECVHLAAGMLLAGYGGVIGTMWSILDKDAPKVARDVYEYLFRDPDRVPDSTESAAALHHAIQRLRSSGASFSSWVPFIYFGR